MVLLVVGDPYPAAFGLVAAAVIAAIPPLQARGAFQAHPLASRQVTGTADDGSLRMAVTGSESEPASAAVVGAARSELDWSTLAGWRETARSFVLRTGASTRSPLYVVPRRAFADPAGQRVFRDLLERHVGGITP
ncbi:YcxB family protein [Solihabitans fulvus]|uniref:YcxB family protein n=1 Tax=Solihabitans fulvus TaxID=1892852 RepID=A0A5B2XRX8_9PSEU|nr:YcxB family protein [Solihabitans fulvus]